jgi:ATPase subunit of ABC transporter with duplicated ATPase domains
LLIDDLIVSSASRANRAGKTTLFRMIIGQEQTDWRCAQARSFAMDQPRDALAAENVFEETAAATTAIGRRDRRARTSRRSASGSDQQRKVGLLSGGERNRLHLAKMLRRGGNVLLLDEPTNDLDVDTLRALEEALVGFSGCVVVISHDRWFLDRIATHMLAFEGDSQVVWFEGNYQDYEADLHRRRGGEADRPHRISSSPCSDESPVVFPTGPQRAIPARAAGVW